ncbi:MAG TPA: hypothetical protein DDX40_02490 [Rikenellaceae bacterium]|nr:hypothetical protein [Rikenellaceae bacterium]
MNVIISYRLSRLVTKLEIFFHFIPPISKFFHNDFNNIAAGVCEAYGFRDTTKKGLAKLPVPSLVYS